jgi:hypothetical protein
MQYNFPYRVKYNYSDYSPQTIASIIAGVCILHIVLAVMIALFEPTRVKGKATNIIGAQLQAARTNPANQVNNATAKKNSPPKKTKQNNNQPKKDTTKETSQAIAPSKTRTQTPPKKQSDNTPKETSTSQPPSTETKKPTTNENRPNLNPQQTTKNVTTPPPMPAPGQLNVGPKDQLASSRLSSNDRNEDEDDRREHGRSLAETPTDEPTPSKKAPLNGEEGNAENRPLKRIDNSNDTIEGDKIPDELESLGKTSSHITFNVKVDKTGKISKIELKSNPDRLSLALTQIAENHIRKHVKFKPAIKLGAPTQGEMLIKITFKLK